MTPPKEQIPSKIAVIPFYIAAALSFLIMSFLCLVSVTSFKGHFFQPALLAITHLAVLGWATMIIFGASNQLTPVIAEQKLASERLPILILILLIIGTTLLVYSFWCFSFLWLTYVGGVLILLSLVLHAINIYNTVSSAKENIINQLLVTAHIWLLLTAVIGFLLLVNLRYPFLSDDHLQYLKVHASIGMGGWLLQLIVAVSSRLIPMFLLSRSEQTRLLNITYYTLNGGLLLFMMNGVLLHSGLLVVGSQIIIFTGILFYMWYIRGCYKSAIRRRIDTGMRQTFIALFLLSVPFLLLMGIMVFENDMKPNIMLAYGFSFVGGFVSTIIMGQTFKTLPFIVWIHITRTDTLPEQMPKDLFNENWVKIQMLLYLPGFLLFLTGILLTQTYFLYTGAIFMLAAAALYFVHVLLVIKKLVT